MAETEPETDTVTISKELLNQLVNIANPSMPNGVDIVNSAIRLMAPPLPPTQDYYVLYRVTWQPERAGHEGPMDHTHGLTVSDPRYVDHEMVEIGELHFVHTTVNGLAEDARVRELAVEGYSDHPQSD